ncbi:MAG: histidine utilization repressor [Burkholderiaceae bacterium]|nr:histidine utilization repressor [Burkholderiaceae bacterium]
MHHQHSNPLTPRVAIENKKPRSKTPVFQSIKSYVLEKIQNGNWLEGASIPSEQSLAKTFEVSRMTVNRALSELSNEGVLNRIQGSGTFVAQRKYQAMLLEIQNIADEVSARGHVHRSDLQLLERCKADEFLAAQFGVPLLHPLFHSVVVHYESDLAIQVEDRYVNPVVAPEYMTHDFQSHTPNEYLMQVAPLQAVRFTIEACMPPVHISSMLNCATTEPCLVLKRQTYSQSQTASYATLWHPASRYKFAGNF